MIDVPTERAKVSTSTSTIANPAPLGLSAFALTTFVLSAANAGLFGGSAIVLGLALFYGGLTQFCAGMWEFRTGNTFGATAFSSYGGFWISLGFASLPLFDGGKSLVVLAGGAEAVGVFLLGWTIFTGIMLLATFRLSVAHITLFAFLFVTFLFLTISDLQGAPLIKIYGGWLGLITACIAWYMALAQVLDAVHSPIKLPLLPIS